MERSRSNFANRYRSTFSAEILSFARYIT